MLQAAGQANKKYKQPESVSGFYVFSGPGCFLQSLLGLSFLHVLFSGQPSQVPPLFRNALRMRNMA